MESATIAANGFRFRVPYGTLLCVSDKPLHGELKLPGMATAFYKRQVAQHLLIGIRAMEIAARHAAREAALAQAAQFRRDGVSVSRAASRRLHESFPQHSRTDCVKPGKNWLVHAFGD